MQKAQKESGMQIMDEVLHNIESSIATYALTEEQENHLLKIVQTGVDRSLENFEQGLEIDGQMRGIISHLNQFSIVLD